VGLRCGVALWGCVVGLRCGVALWGCVVGLRCGVAPPHGAGSLNRQLYHCLIALFVFEKR
jgi:hypothetical protein